jgi:hypothetical protein
MGVELDKPRKLAFGIFPSQRPISTDVKPHMATGRQMSFPHLAPSPFSGRELREFGVYVDTDHKHGIDGHEKHRADDLKVPVAVVQLGLRGDPQGTVFLPEG